MKPNLQHAIERVERPGGSHEGVGRKKKPASHYVQFDSKEEDHQHRLPAMQFLHSR